MRWSKPPAPSTPPASRPNPLATLRDVDGVVGSFVIGASGALVTKDLPAVFDEPIFLELGQRVIRLEETLSSAGGRPEGVVLRFAKHEIHLRFVAGGVLCVVTASAVNTSALAMALLLAARKIEPELAARERHAGAAHSLA